MSEEESGAEGENGEEDDAPAVELGEGPEVEGAPIARVASRLTWPMERSEVDRLEGETVVRTPDGPIALSEVLDRVDTTYFERRQEFVSAVQDAVGVSPVRTQ